MKDFLEPVTPTREAISARRIYGNAYMDATLMFACEALVCDDTAPMEDRKWAIDYLSNTIMGLDEPAATEEDVRRYVQLCQAKV